MTVVSVADAQPRLKELLEQAEAGEAVVITTESGVRLRVLREETVDNADGEGEPGRPTGPANRVGGQLKGQFVVGPEFFEPMDEEELALWYGDSPRGRLLEEIGKEWEMRDGEKA